MRKWWLILAALLPLVVLWAVWRFGYDGADPRLIFWPRPPEPAEPAALDEIVSLHVRRRPLRDVLAELADKHGVAIDIDRAALKDAGVTVNQAVSIDFEGASLRSALALLAQQANDDLLVADRDGGLLVTTRSYYGSILGNSVSRVYPLDKFMMDERRIADDELALAIETVVAPESWKNVGGAGEIELLPGALLVKQTLQAQRQVQALLDALARLQREPGRLEPIDVGIPAAAQPGHKRLLAALDEPSEADFAETPLDEVAAQLSRKHGIPVALDYRELASVAVGRDTTVTFSSQGASLRSLLTRLLADLDLTFAVGDDALIVTTPEGAELPSRLHLRLYPVGDLVNNRFGTPDYDSLINALTPSIAPNGWSGVGGHGVVVAAAGALAINQTDEVHRQIERLLADIRHTWRPSVYPPPPDRKEDIAHRRIEQALAKPVSLDFSDTALADVAREISKQAGVPVVVDRRVIDVLGIGTDTPVNFSAGELPLEHALRLMLRSFDLDFMVTDEVLLISTPEECETRLLTRCHDMRRLNPDDADSLINLITTTVSPDSWDGSGPGPIDTFNGLLIVSQTRQMHQQVAALLAALERQVDAPKSLAPIDVVICPQELQRKMLEALDEPAQFDFADTPLGDVAKQLSARHHVPVLLDARALDAVGLGYATPVTGRAAGLRLESALRLLLRRHSLTFMVRDGAILITVSEEAEADGMELRVYPYADLVDTAHDVDSLQDFVVELVDRDNWGDTGGPAAIDAFRYARVFVVLAPRETQQRVERLLAAVRSLRAESTDAAAEPASLTVDAPPGSAEASILNLLQQPADVIVSSEPLDDALERLAREHDLPLWLDRAGIQQAGVDLQRPVSFTLCGATLGRALELLLAKHSLRYCLRDESLLITSPESRGDPFRPVRVYSIADLRQRYQRLVKPPQLPWPPRFDSPRYPFDYFDVPDSAATFDDQLIDALEKCVGFPSTDNGRIARLDDVLGVCGDEAKHREIQRTLRDIRCAHGLAAPAPPASLLERRVSLHCRNLPLAEAVAQLSRDNNLAVLLDLPHDEIDVGERPVSCALDGVPLREAISAISPADVPLAVFDDGDVVFVRLAKGLKQRVSTRVYPLGELLDSFPELDSGFFRELIVAGVTPLDWEKGKRNIAIAALPRAMLVPHNAAGHGEVKRLLEFAASQSEAFPRPSDLQRDDNRPAQAALAARIRAAEDPLEAIWLVELIATVDNPIPELEESLLERFVRAAELKQFAVLHCLPWKNFLSQQRLAGAVPYLVSMFTETTDAFERFEILSLLAELGSSGLEAAARQLNHPEDLSDDEIATVLAALNRHKGATAVPAFVELLPGDYGIVAGRMLKEVDPQGIASHELVERRLAEPHLSRREREELLDLRKRIDNLFGFDGGEEP